MPPLSDKELEERLTAAGNSLLQPPSSLDELLPLLDQIEELLSKVEQSPAKSMQAALSPLMKALVAEELVKHPNVDVKVGVASCISEITRITAPDAPYDDDKMKDVFQLIVSSFENLADTSSRSHEKRATILETVAKVRSCVIMLDLECDQMIIEMFQNFLKSIRVYHAEVIFASMETIMTLVLEESEDISPDLLNPILATLKRNNEAVMPIAKKLAERVIQNSADKLRPYLTQALESLDASLDDYSEVVLLVVAE
ncbi:UNVERIFIED_CONTAM: Sister chromatid cohesion protein PDS5 [Sesamum radiatum]|uniref:Sister chromatid cohesion protein PDS5 n=1 Tax=Sesamum radiatum TaxID=300843 RepID=A0AAW2KYX3_SESRA